jgi:hypothetical protein
VIECLALGVPVIGTEGAASRSSSPGTRRRTGADRRSESLAAAIVARWRRSRERSARLPAAMDRTAAADALLALAGRV